MARYHLALIDHATYDHATAYVIDNDGACCDDNDCGFDGDHINIFTDDELAARLDRAVYDAAADIVADNRAAARLYPPDVYGTFYPTVPYGSARQHDSPAY